MYFIQQIQASYVTLHYLFLQANTTLASLSVIAAAEAKHQLRIFVFILPAINFVGKKPVIFCTAR
jgi:hypothetical protein